MPKAIKQSPVALYHHWKAIADRTQEELDEVTKAAAELRKELGQAHRDRDEAQRRTVFFTDLLHVAAHRAADGSYGADMLGELTVR